MAKRKRVGQAPQLSSLFVSLGVNHHIVTVNGNAIDLRNGVLHIIQRIPDLDSLGSVRAVGVGHRLTASVLAQVVPNHFGIVWVRSPTSYLIKWDTRKAAAALVVPDKKITVSK